MSLSLIVQAVVLLAALFLMVRGVQVLHENLCSIERMKKMRLSVASLAFVVPIILVTFFATGRMSTVDMILPLVIGFNLLFYGVVFAQGIMSRSVASLSDVSPSVVLPMVLTYALVVMSVMDGAIDRFEAVLMLALGGVLWLGMSSRVVTTTDATAISQTFAKTAAFVLVAVLAIYLGAHYVFAGLLFFSANYTLSLVFLALTIVPLIFALPLILFTFSLARRGQGAGAMTHGIEVTLVITLFCIGVAGCIAPLETTSATIESGLWYVVLFATATVLGLLSGSVGRRSGLMLFLLFIFCMVKLVTEM